MRIKRISIKNFRNYPELDIQINNDIVVITGPNAVGKTNLLESVYFASLFKSFRDDTQFIFLKDHKNMEIKITIEREGQEHILEAFLEKRDKVYASFLIDGVKKKRKDTQGFMRVVIFDPTEVDMFSKTPDHRRKYLNMVLSQKDPQYLEALSAHKKILLRKNKLLQDLKAGRSKAEDLKSWNEQLINVGLQIIFGRKKFINFLNNGISEIYTTISGFHRPIEVFYKSIEGEAEEEIKQNFAGRLEKMEGREIALGTSLVGPHRDDFYLQSDGLFLSPFSSRGELRSQVMALKIMELEYLSKKNETPILLLDDVLSELDDTRRTFLLKYLQGKFQTFITTTHHLEMPAQHITLTPVTEKEKEEVES